MAVEQCAGGFVGGVKSGLLVTGRVTGGDEHVVAIAEEHEGREREGGREVGSIRLSTSRSSSSRRARQCSAFPSVCSRSLSAAATVSGPSPSDAASATTSSAVNPARRIRPVRWSPPTVDAQLPPSRTGSVGRPDTRTSTRSRCRRRDANRIAWADGVSDQCRSSTTRTRAGRRPGGSRRGAATSCAHGPAAGHVTVAAGDGHLDRSDDESGLDALVDGPADDPVRD